MKQNQRLETDPTTYGNFIGEKVAFYTNGEEIQYKYMVLVTTRKKYKVGSIPSHNYRNINFTERLRLNSL